MTPPSIASAIPRHAPYRRAYDLLEPACLEALRASLDKPAKNVPELNEKLVRFALCFIDHAQQVFQLRVDFREQADEEMLVFREIRQEIAEALKPSTPPALSTFDKVLVWFRDKVLPTLVVAMITGAVSWFVFVNSFVNQGLP